MHMREREVLDIGGVRDWNAQGWGEGMGTVRGHGGRERSGVMTGEKEGTVGGKGKGMVRDHGEIREQSQGDKGKERGGKGMVRGHGVSGTLSIPIGD